MPRFDADAVQQLVTDIVTAAGAKAASAAILARALVEADLTGASTHGVSRLAIYVERIKLGLIDPQAPLSIERPRPGVLLADACNGIGQVQAFKVLEALIATAREQGSAAAAIRNSQHFGALSFYCRHAAAQGCILFATTNCEPSMAPHGGLDAFFGTNPLAAAFPTGKDFPLSIDLATSKVARGNIIAAQKQGKSIPGDWALDPEGNPTTDAAAALQGTVLTMAGHKGYALALMAEMFAGVLSGSAVGPDIGSMYKDKDRPQNVGHFFFCLDVGAFMELEAFEARADALIDRIKSGRKRPGFNEIRVPGEGSARSEAQRRKDGIELDAKTVEELRGLCKEYGVEFVGAG